MCSPPIGGQRVLNACLVLWVSLAARASVWPCCQFLERGRVHLVAVLCVCVVSHVSVLQWVAMVVPRSRPCADGPQWYHRAVGVCPRVFSRRWCGAVDTAREYPGVWYHVGWSAGLPPVSGVLGSVARGVVVLVGLGLCVTGRCCCLVCCVSCDASTYHFATSLFAKLCCWSCLTERRTYVPLSERLSWLASMSL